MASFCHAFPKELPKIQNFRPFTSLTGLNAPTANNPAPWLAPDVLRLLLLQYGNLANGNLANLDPSRAALLLNQLQLMQMSQNSKNLAGQKIATDEHDGPDANDDAINEKLENDHDNDGSVGKFFLRIFF